MVEFVLPRGLRNRKWAVVIDTKEPRFLEKGSIYTEDKTLLVTERSVVVLRRVG